MNAPYFKTFELQERLRASADALVGTPWSLRGAVGGSDGGVCCHGLVYLGLKGAGWILPESLPMGRANHAKHSSEEIMLTWLRSHPLLLQEIPLDIADIRVGDVLPQQYGMCSHHLSLAVPFQPEGQIGVLEVWAGKKAGIRNLSDATVSAKISAIFRPLEL